MEHPGITQRPPAYAELLVDSMDRYQQGFPVAGAITTSSDWKLNLQQIALNGYLTRLAISQIQFFWNLPTIITGYNDQLRVIAITGGVPTAVTVNIPGGFYTPDDLATAIAAALNASPVAAATWTCTFDPLNSVFLLSVTGAGYTFTLAAPAQGVNRYSRFLQTTGWQKVGVTPDTAAYSGIPTMLPMRFIDLCSSYLTKYQRVKDITTLPSNATANVIARIYPTAPNTRVPLTNDGSVGSQPFTICVDYNTPKHIRWSPDEGVSNFDLQLRDENGDLVPFDLELGLYGCEYQLTILATES